MARFKDAAIGFRVHTGWSTAVILTGTRVSPRIVERRRVELCDPSVPDSRAPYHAALGRPEAEGALIVERACEVTRRVATRSIRDLVDKLSADGFRLVGVGLVVGSIQNPAKLGNPHVHAHAAEGQLYREVLEAGAAACGAFVRVFVERDLYTETPGALGHSAQEIKRVAAALGKDLGPPWRAEEKAAAVAAWAVLS